MSQKQSQQNEQDQAKAILASLEGKEAGDILKALFVDFSLFKTFAQNSFQSFQSDITLLNTSFNTHKEELSKYRKELDTEREEVQQTLDYHDEQIKKVEEEMKGTNMRLKLLEGRMAKQEKELYEVKAELSREKSRTMSSNILVHKLPEQDRESRDILIQMIQTVFIDEMKIPVERVSKIQFGRVHRLGQKNKEKTEPRSIVANLPVEDDRMLVFGHLKNLDKSKFAISGQFPPDVSEKRALLKNVMRSEEFKNKKTRLIQDTLYIEGKPYSPGQLSHKNAPQGYDPSTIEWEKAPQIRVTDVITDNANSFIGYSAKVKSKQEAQFVIDMTKGMQCQNPATHLVFAYRISYGGGSSVLEYQCDDGEWGGAKRILEKLRDSSKTDIIVIVARWYGSHIGPRRFRHYVAATEEAMLREHLGPNYHR